MGIRKRIIIFSLIFGWLAGIVFAEQKKQVAGVLAHTFGQVEIQRLGAEKFVRARSGDTVYEGEKIKVGRNSRAGLILLGGGEIKINQNTFLTVGPGRTVMGQARNWINLIRGRIYNKVHGLRKLDVKTPVATCAVRGTEYQTQVEDDGSTAVIVVAGAVSLENEFGSAIVNPGEMATVKPGKAPEPPQKINEEKIKQETGWQQEIKIEKKVLRLQVGSDKEKEGKTIELRFRK